MPAVLHSIFFVLIPSRRNVCSRVVLHFQRSTAEVRSRQSTTSHNVRFSDEHKPNAGGTSYQVVFFFVLIPSRRNVCSRVAAIPFTACVYPTCLNVHILGQA